MARVINKQIQKTSGADVLLSRKKIRKTLGGMAAAPPPPPLVHVCPRVKICLVFLKHYRKTVFDPRQEKNFFFISNIGNKKFQWKDLLQKQQNSSNAQKQEISLLILVTWFFIFKGLFINSPSETEKIFAGINSKTWSFNKRKEISSAVERMVLRGGSKLGKNETYDADTLIIHDTACAYIFISTAFYTL